MTDIEWVASIKSGDIKITKSDAKAFTRLSNDEKRWIEISFTCPDCLTGNFVEGPRGGLSVNVLCDNSDCGSKFNLTSFKDGEKAILLFGERI